MHRPRLLLHRKDQFIGPVRLRLETLREQASDEFVFAETLVVWFNSALCPNTVLLPDLDRLVDVLRSHETVLRCLFDLGLWLELLAVARLLRLLLAQQLRWTGALVLVVCLYKLVLSRGASRPAPSLDAVCRVG